MLKGQISCSAELSMKKVESLGSWILPVSVYVFRANSSPYKMIILSRENVTPSNPSFPIKMRFTRMLVVWPS